MNGFSEFKQNAIDHDWYLEDNHFLLLQQVWDYSNFATLLKEWSDSQCGTPNGFAKFWEVSFACHLFRLRLRGECVYEPAWPESSDSARPVDFQIGDDLYIELTTADAPAGFLSHQEFVDLLATVPAEEPALDLRIQQLAPLWTLDEKSAFVADLTSKIKSHRDAKQLVVRVGEIEVARVTVRPTTARAGGWEFRGRSYRMEQFRSLDGLSKDQAALRSAIRHATEKVPSGFDRTLMVGVCCHSGYFAFNSESAMQEMLFDGYDVVDETTGRRKDRIPGMWPAEAPNYPFVLGVYSGTPQLDRFSGLSRYTIHPYVKRVSGVSEWQVDSDGSVTIGS